MAQLDADTQQHIQDLREKGVDADRRFRELHGRWRAGLKAAQDGKSSAAIEAALTGTDADATGT